MEIVELTRGELGVLLALLQAAGPSQSVEATTVQRKLSAASSRMLVNDYETRDA